MKSLRLGRATIAEAYASDEGGEIMLINANIPEYFQAGRFNHEPKRTRKLLLKKKEIAKLIIAVQREGMTIVPLKMYFNEKGRAKLEIALAKGKKLHDKRDAEKKRDWSRDKQRLLTGSRLGGGRLAGRPWRRTAPVAGDFVAMAIAFGRVAPAPREQRERSFHGR